MILSVASSKLESGCNSEEPFSGTQREVEKCRVSIKQQLEERTREFAEALAQQTATSEILRVIASSPTDLKPVMAAVAENAARVCGASDALIFLCENGFLRHVARYGSVMTAQQPGELGPPIDRESVAGRGLSRTGKPFTCTICVPSQMNLLRPRREGYPKALGPHSRRRCYAKMCQSA